MFSATKRQHLEPAWGTNVRMVNPIGWLRSSLKWLVAAGLVSWLSPALAEEPRNAKEPRPLMEPTELTQVADAFDEGDPFDLNLSIGYQYSSRSADILRDTATASGLNTRGTDKIAEYKESTHRMLLRADLGLFHDLALVVRLPVIVGSSQTLGNYLGPQTQSYGLRGAGNEQLFSLPFSSPHRSGIEYLSLGLDWAPMNQFRDHTKPTWVIGVEGRFSVSEPMHACNDHPAAGQIKCAAPGDVNRDGVQDPNKDAYGNVLEGGGGSRQPGVSRGTTALELHTYVSKRIKYIEPYAGFRTLFEFTNASSDYGATDLRGNLVNHPPLQGTFLIGMAVIPWEVRSEYQRLTLDMRVEATYRSEGRDYNELFDALGSSAANALRMPNYTGYVRSTDTDPNRTSALDTTSQRVYVSGLMDTQQHVITRYAFGVTYQVNEYIKFGVGTALNHIQAHYLTYDQPCNASLNGNINESGPCRGRTTSASDWQPTGIPNPNYRPVINAPGRRFLVDGSTGIDGWLNATVMF